MIYFNNIRMKDISLAEKTLLNEYKQLWQAQNWQGVADFLTAHPEFKYKIFDAENWNRVSNIVGPDDKIEIDYDFLNGDSSLNFDFVNNISHSPESVSYDILKDAQDISEASMAYYYVGQWTDGTTYVENNLVSMDGYHLFYCIQEHIASSSNKPTSNAGNQYWIQCKGFLGNLGTEGLSVSQTQPASLTNQDVWIELAPQPPTLMSGPDFNTAIYNLIPLVSSLQGFHFTNELPPQYSTSPNRYTSTVVSDASSSEVITAYYDTVYGYIYVYCPNTIYANANCSSMFKDFTNCSFFDFSNFNSSKITNTSSMFENCTAIQNLNLGTFNTTKVTNMSRMFYTCTNLRGIYVGSSWSTESVTSGSSMFLGCTSLSGKGSDGRMWAYNSSYTNYASAKIGDDSTSVPAYLTLSIKVILCTNDGVFGRPSVTISQNGKTLLFVSGGYMSNFIYRKELINIDPTINTIIDATPYDHDYMYIYNQDNIIYQKTNFSAFEYIVQGGTAFDKIEFYSED